MTRRCSCACARPPRRQRLWTMTLLVAMALGPHETTATGGAMSLELHRLPDQRIHPETYQRRRLQGPHEFESVPLNLGMGTHYAWVYAGTPPQRASVITDTGSSIMAFPCSGCDGCGVHTDQPFAASASSTLTHVTCEQRTFFNCHGCTTGGTCSISQSYMEGSSWHAAVVEDIVYLGGAASANDTNLRNQYATHFMFGCQSSETGLFISQVADGIMGLANNDHHIVAKLFNEKKIPEKLFSLCFAPDGGAMSIGQPDTSRHNGTIEYAKVTRTGSHDFYGVELLDVRIGGKSIDPPADSLKRGQYIVDSGTTDSYLPSSMKAEFNRAFEQVTGGLGYHVSSSSCVGYTDEELKRLPNIELVLRAEDGGNLTLSVKPDDYLLKEDNGKYCSGIFLSERTGGVIGANIMMGRDVIFDQGQQRVGFVDADCNYRRLTTNGTTTTPAPSPTTTAPTTTTTTPAVSKGTVTNSTATPSTAPTTVPTATTEIPATSTNAPVPTSAAPESPTPSSTSSVPASSSPPPSETPVATTLSVPATTTAAVSSPPEATTEPLSQSGNHTSGHSNASGDGHEDHPMVLTIVGVVLAMTFLLAAVFSVRRQKSTRKNWSRVNEDDDELDDDDDDDEEGLMERGEKRGSRKPKAQRSDEDQDLDDDDDDDDDRSHVRRGGQLQDADEDHDDDDDDDEDEIFDREAHAHDEHKHDARTLERL